MSATLITAENGLVCAVLACAALIIIILVAHAQARLRASRAPFYPRKDLRCGGDRARVLRDGDEITDPLNRGGTVVIPRYASTTRVQPDRAADSPEIAESAAEMNPLVGLGLSSRVRAWGDRVRGAQACARDGLHGAAPGEAGRLIPTSSAKSEREDARPCSYRNPEFCTDGPFGEGVLYAD